jgi:hypothetical protein
MLKVKKDRLKEVDKQIKKCIKRSYWTLKSILQDEKQTLLREIKELESKRGV